MDRKKEVKEVEIGAVVLIGLVVIIVAWPAILAYVRTVPASVSEPAFYYGAEAISLGKSILGVAIGLSFPVSLFFLIAIVYSVEQLKRIRRKEAELYDLKVEPAYEAATDERDLALARRWESVVKHVSAAAENDWKQGILEADAILDDILTKLGYRGEGVGEKLKRAEPADFATLNDAWEAHKVRNRIAHDGSAFSLTHHEANRVFQLYKRIFEEFYYI